MRSIMENVFSCIVYFTLWFSQRSAPLFPLVTEMEIPLQAELFILWPLLLIKSLMTGRKAESCFRQHSFPLHLKFD